MNKELKITMYQRAKEQSDLADRIQELKRKKIKKSEIIKILGISGSKHDSVWLQRKHIWDDYMSVIDDPLSALTVRTYRMLWNNGITTLDQVKEAFSKNRFNPHSYPGLRNCGIRSFLEICSLLGFPAPIKLSKDTQSKMIKIIKDQSEAIDILFAKLIEKDPEFFPSKSGKPWEAIEMANRLIKEIENNSLKTIDRTE